MIGKGIYFKTVDGLLHRPPLLNHEDNNPPRFDGRCRGQCTVTRAADAKPNIIYIVADDLGWKDVGFNSSDIKTPNLDKLAQIDSELQAIYAQPMCSPTRAALMIGRFRSLRSADARSSLVRLHLWAELQ